MALRDFLTQKAIIQRETFAQDSFGEQVATVTIEQRGIPCLVRPMSAELLTEQGRDASKRMVRIYFQDRPYPTDDTRARRIKIGPRIYRPEATLNMNSLHRLWEVDCELVTG